MSLAGGLERAAPTPGRVFWARPRVGRGSRQAEMRCAIFVTAQGCYGHGRAGHVAMARCRNGPVPLRPPHAGELPGRDLSQWLTRTGE